MKNKKFIYVLFSIIILFAVGFALCTPVFAEEANTETSQTQSVEETEKTDDSGIGSKAIAAALVVGLAAAAGTVGMGVAIAKSAESVARQPEASGKINSVMMLGLVFIETLVIYALIIAILIIFVL